MKNGTFVGVLTFFTFFWAAHLAAAPATAMKNLAAIQPKRIASQPALQILLSRPFDATINKKARDTWFGTLAEAFFGLGLSQYDRVKLVPWDMLASSIPGYTDVRTKIGKNACREFATGRNIGVIVFIQYEIVRETHVTFFLEAVTLARDSTIITVESNFNTAQAAHVLDSSLTKLAQSIGLRKSEPRASGPSLIGSNEKNLRQLGNLLYSQRYAKTVSTVIAAAGYESLAENDSLLLSSYLAALNFSKLDSLDKTVGFVEKLTDVLRLPDRQLYTSACRGMRLMKQYDKALDLVQKAKNAGCLSGALLAEQAQVFMQQGDTVRARCSFDSTLVLDKNNTTALFFCARNFVNGNRPKEGLATAERLVLLEPRNGQAYVEKGRSLRMLGRKTDAIAAFESALRLVRDNPVPFLALGDLYAEKKLAGVAADNYQMALQFFPGDTALTLKTARLLARSGKGGDALSLYNALPPASLADPKVMGEKGLLELARKDTASACLHLALSVQQGESDIGILQTLAGIYHKTGNDSAALPLLLRLHPVIKDKKWTALAITSIYLKWNDPARADPYLCSIASASTPSSNPKGALLENRQWQDIAFRIGELYMQQRMREKAAKRFEQNIAAFPGDMRNYEPLARLCMGEDRYTAAAELLKKAMARSPKTPIFQKLMGQSLIALKDTAGAIKYYSRYCISTASDTAVLCDLGKWYYAVKSYSQAAACLKKATVVSPEDIETQTLLGLSYERLGDMALLRKNRTAAQQYFIMASEFPGGYESAALKSARFYREGKKREKAIEIYRMALMKNPANDEARYWLIASALQENNVETAMELKRDRTDAKSSGWSLLAKGRIMEKQGSYDNAFTAFSTALHAFPDNVEALAGCGRTSLELNKYNTAQIFFSKAMALQPDDPELFYGLGVAFIATGDFSSALGFLKEAMRRGPKDPKVYYSLAQLESKQKNHTNAIRYLGKGLAVDSQNVKLLLALGQEYRSLKESRKAISIYEKAARSPAPEGVEAYKIIGDIYFKNYNDKGQAKAYYTMYLNAGGKDKNVIEEMEHPKPPVFYLK